MQGRLVPPEGGRFQSFPRNNWRREFELAKRAGLDSIEWIFDLYGEDVNPLGTDAGLAEMSTLGDRYGIRVASVCADYFMDRPIVRANAAEREELAQRLLWLVGRCKKIGIERIVIPFVDASRILSDDDEQHALEVLRTVLPVAERASIEIHLETAFAPDEFKRFLAKMDAPNVRVNYDSGNSASLGYDPSEEFRAYGSSIGSVHIKDRKLGAGTVALGTGDTQLDSVFEQLARLGYTGDYILQAARGEEHAEVALAKANLEFVRTSIARANRGAAIPAP
jgi:hexulose-6-phosphate isomerase